MTSDDLDRLQEAPTGKPWERDWIRDWEPAPLDRAEYDRHMEHMVRRRFTGVNRPIRGRTSRLLVLDDPTLPSKPRYIDPLL
jgi:hypothetical protein